MEYGETLKWTGIYLGLWLLAAALGGAIAVAGVALGGLAPLGYWSMTPVALRYGGAPTGGAVLIGLGVLVFKYGAAAALVHVLVTATEERVAQRFPAEAIKSDILSVLDARLSEMHDELRETRQRLGGGGGSGQFEFPDE